MLGFISLTPSKCSLCIIYNKLIHMIRNCAIVAIEQSNGFTPTITAYATAATVWPMTNEQQECAHVKG